MTPQQRDCVHKRWTLNVLIQGAASHIHLTAVHLVRDSIEKMNPGLTELYQEFVLLGQLNYLCGDLMLMQGRPNRCFGWSKQPRELIQGHPVLALHANDLARAEAKFVRRHAKQRKLRMIPIITAAKLPKKAAVIQAIEAGFRSQLEQLAYEITTDIWGIDEHLLHGELTPKVAFGEIPKADNFMTEVLQQGIAGYGGVLREEGRWKVMAKAWVFPLLVHELTKGTAELICMHGMSEWSDRMYQKVIREVDRLDNETLCIQVGPELWRRFLEVIPRGVPLSVVLMHVAKLAPEPLHALINDVIADPEIARMELVNLAR